jgi:hypothetical protein
MSRKKNRKPAGDEAVSLPPIAIHAPPDRVVSIPPVETRHQQLPFGELTWENFERLCYRVAAKSEPAEHYSRYGK